MFTSMEWRVSIRDFDGDDTGAAGSGAASGLAERRLSSDWFIDANGGCCAHVDVTEVLSASALVSPSKLFELRVEGWTRGAPHATAAARGAAKFILALGEDAQVASTTHLSGMSALQPDANLNTENVTDLELAAKEV